MKVEILYKSLHMPGWQSVEAPTFLQAMKAFDYELKVTMDRNPHITLYQITDFRINLIRDD